MRTDTLVDLRQKIDEVDHQLLSNLSKRKELVKLVGEYKQAYAIKPLDRSRWEQVLVSRTRWGKNLGLDSTFIIDVFELIHRYSLQIEGEICKK